LPPERRVGWQPSRFLANRAQAERAFQLAERLGNVNAAAKELGTTWPSLRKAFTRHGLGMPARNLEAVRQRAIAAAHQHTGQPATPSPDPMLVALNPAALPARERSPAELYQWVRREEQYATLGANVVVELYSESHARQPTTGAWAIIRRASAAIGWPANAPAAPSAATPTERTARPSPSNRCANRRCCRSRPTVAAEVMCSHRVQLCAVVPRRIFAVEQRSGSAHEDTVVAGPA
jgi:hypothetical protein